MNESPRKEYKTAICPYCGKERTYEHRDAYTEIDFSHGWPDKQIPEWDNDEGCDCILGSLKATRKKIRIKPQCANCAFQKNACCTSEEEKKSLTSQFGIVGPLHILDLSNTCKYWKLSDEIFKPFIEITKEIEKSAL